jgi:hypothetical protein
MCTERRRSYMVQWVLANSLETNSYHVSLSKYPLEIWPSYDHSSRSCSCCQESCFIMALSSIIICQFQIGLESVTSHAFHVILIQWFPLFFTGPFPRLNQFFDWQNRGRHAQLPQQVKFGNIFKKSTKVKDCRETLMGFWRRVTKTLCTQNEANAFSLWNNNLGHQGILECSTLPSLNKIHNMEPLIAIIPFSINH